MSGLGKENTTLGFRKSRPLTGRGLLEERVPVELALRAPLGPAWLQALQSSFCEALLLDRHFLGAIESCVCVGAVADWEDSRSPVDGLKLVLAREFDNALDFRELPCSLSRLYFSGRLRLRRLVRRLSPPQLAVCLQLAADDGFVPSDNDDDDDTRVEDEDVSPAYEAQCACVEAYWRLVLDLLFRSFESCLLGLMQRAATGARFLSVGLTHALQNDAYWADFPACTAPLDDQWLYLCTVWRCNATLALERALQPWENDECREWLQYRLKLFRATHLDLMTAMVRLDCYGDAMLHACGVVAANWPAAHRVCCAEEMPDFICYATDNFKTGTNLKERNTRDDKFGHLFVNKTSPNICKIRNMFDITIRYGEEDPLIYEAMKNVLRCVLLGHLPRAQGHLSAMAAIKINAFFAPHEADRQLSEAQFAELTRNKSLKRKKNGEQELQYTKTFFILWFLVCRHFVLFLLTEFLLYIAESSGYFDEICATTYKWPRGKEIIRLGCGRCRLLLSRQTARDTPFDWTVIEFEEKTTKQQQAAQQAKGEERTYDIKSGEIKKYHHWRLKSASKIKKDDFCKILLKKMTGTEKHVTQAQLDAAVFLDAEGCMSTEEFHFLCWYMSLSKSPVFETRWFQAMGMSLYALTKLRSWQFLYYVYDVPDNSFNEPICEMRARSMRDYLMLKTALRTIEYYRQKQYVYHLPLDYARQQIWVQRRMLGLDDHERTPPHLGLVYQCRGCMRFANSVVLDAPTVPRPKGEKATVPTYSFLSKAFYNAENGALYCMRCANPHTRQAALDRPLTTVMRKRDGSVLIQTTRAVEVRAPLVSAEPALPRPSFLFGDRNLREQTERKLEWLMQTSVREMLGAEPCADEPPQSSTEAPVDAPARRVCKKKDGIKKLIQARIDAVIVREGHDCQSPMMRVDMVGIMKNGKVLCMQCPLMCELSNHGMTADGSLTCGRHKPPEAPPDRLHIKLHLHPEDVAPHACACHFCGQEGARLRFPVQDEQLALHKLQLCKECFDAARSSTRAEVVSMAQLTRRLGK